MTKKRPHNSIEAAVDTIRSALRLDDADCRRLCNVSENMVRKYSDPDHDTCINVYQALSLDVHFVNETGEPPPIYTTFKYLLEKAIEGNPNHIPDVTAAVLDFTQCTGNLAGALSEAQDVNSPGGQELTAREKETLKGYVKRAFATLDRIDRALS